MEKQLKSIVAAAANDTLEKLAFLFASPDDERFDDAPEPTAAGRVDFDGYFSGSLLMLISTTVVPELACNMLGIDDDGEISGADQDDAMKEILNVICGNVLPAIAGDQVEFNIGAPEIISQLSADTIKKQNKPTCVVRLMLEEGFCDLFLFIEGAIPEIKLNSDAEPLRLSH